MKHGVHIYFTEKKYRAFGQAKLGIHGPLTAEHLHVHG